MDKTTILQIGSLHLNAMVNRENCDIFYGNSEFNDITKPTWSVLTAKTNTELKQFLDSSLSQLIRTRMAKQC